MAVDAPEHVLEIPNDVLEFWQAATGIEDKDALLAHIRVFQEKAVAIYDYPCIRSFRFAKLRLCRHPKYNEIVKRMKQDTNSLLLEVGCFMGCDLYKMAYDGVASNQLIGTDLEQPFIDIGRQLLPSASKVYNGIRFVSGDLFNNAFLSLPSNKAEQEPQSIRTLSQLQGQINFLHCCAVFHLFDEAKQSELGRRLLTLVDRQSRFVIFGSQRGLPVAAEKSQPPQRFLHDPQTWQEMWSDIAEEQGIQVKVDSSVRLAEPTDAEGWLEWTVEGNL